jgi:hypothetical protein
MASHHKHSEVGRTMETVAKGIAEPGVILRSI